MATTIVLNDDKSLRLTNLAKMYERESCENILLLLPQKYNNEDISEYTVNLHWKNEDNIGNIITATKMDELRSSYYQFIVDLKGTAFTHTVCDITVWIEIINHGGFHLKSGTVIIPVLPHETIDTIIDETKLTMLEQYLLKFEQIKSDINDTYNKQIALGRIMSSMLKDMKQLTEVANNGR
jgi:hypothetical protein